jgi:hypothetical protein
MSILEPAKWGQEIGDYLSKLKQVKPLKGADLLRLAQQRAPPL